MRRSRRSVRRRLHEQFVEEHVFCQARLYGCAVRAVRVGERPVWLSARSPREPSGLMALCEACYRRLTAELP